MNLKNKLYSREYQIMLDSRESKKRARFTWIQISREIHVNRKNTLNSREIFLGNAWFWFHVQTEKALRIRHDFPVLGESFREVLLGDWGSYGSSFHYN